MPILQGDVTFVCLLSGVSVLSAAGDSGKGMSYSLNTALPNVSFGTLHVYPQAMGVPFSSAGDTDNYTWVDEHFITPRAVATQKLGKPLMIEEFGLTSEYGLPNNVSNARSVKAYSVVLIMVCVLHALQNWAQHC